MARIRFPSSLAIFLSLVPFARPAGATQPQFGAPAALNSSAGSDSGADREVALATDRAGTWIAAWESDDTLAGTIGTDSDILFARSTNGATWSAARALNTDAGLDLRIDARTRIATDGQGAWIAVWDATLDFSSYDVMFSRSLDNGVTWSAPAILTGTPAPGGTIHVAPVVATDGQGAWVVVWYSNDSLGNTIGTDLDLLFARSTDRGATWSVPAAFNSNAGADTGSDFFPDLAADDAGGWIASWVSSDTLGGTIGADDDILFARSTDGGQTWSAPAAIAAYASADSEQDFGPTIAADGSGTWMVAWESRHDLDGTIGADWDLLVVRSTNGGLSWNAPAALNRTATVDPGDAADREVHILNDRAGNWVAAWESLYDLGGTIGGEPDILVATSTTAGLTWTFPIALNTNAGSDSGNDRKPVLATNRAGAWMAAWHSGENLGGTIGTDLDVLFAVGGHVCGDGDPDPGEACDDGNAGAGDCCAPACTAEPAGQACADSIPGDCADARCNGAGTCNQSAVAEAASYVCRPDVGNGCDVADQCDGTRLACPPNGFRPNGTNCADALACDGDEACAAGQCTGTPIDCSDGDVCTADACQEPGMCSSAFVSGCCRNSGECDDANLCTVNVCSAPGGTCQFNRISSCCVSDGDCNDGSLCSSDACNLATNRCEFSPIAGCCTTDTDCADTNACTTDTCNTATGECTSAPRPACCNLDGDCNDGDACTADACSGSGGACTNAPIPGCCATDSDCNDGLVCTQDACDQVTDRCETEPVPGCCTANEDCGDGNACTTDACDLARNACTNPPIPGCCSADTDCDDRDPCTTDRCAGNVCEAERVPGCAPDAGTTPDAQRPDAAPIAPDAGEPDAAPVTPPDEGGCGCRAASRGGEAESACTFAALIVIALVRGRRRSR